MKKINSVGNNNIDSFLLTLSFTVSMLHNYVINGYIACIVWSSYTFQDNLLM